MTQEHINRLVLKLADNSIQYHEYLELMDFIKEEHLFSKISLSEAMAQIENEEEYIIVEDRLKADNTYQNIISSERFTAARKKTANRLKVAAIWVCIACTAALFGYYLIQSGPSKIYKENIVYHSIVTPKGKKEKATLKDGTVIWLNSGSKLTYSNAYDISDRKVELMGEAYFEVAQDQLKPFVVSVGEMSVTVLGTGFNVNSFEQDKLSVTVKHGKVKVQDQDTEISLLTRNHHLNYDKSNRTAQVLRIPAENAVKWTQNILSFDDANLADAAEVLSRWYDVSFVFENEEIKNCRFSITFLPGESIDKVLKIIGTLKSFNYSKQGKTIFIKGGSC